MVEGRPKTPLFQTDGERGFIFCDSEGKTKKMIAAKLDMRASKSITEARKPETPSRSRSKLPNTDSIVK